MAVIRIEKLIPSSGADPTEGYDSASPVGFTQWEPDDEARFSVVVPETYVGGSNVLLKLHESTPSVTGRHAWQLSTLLVRPDVHVTAQQAPAETVSGEYEAAPVADRLTIRTLAATGATGAGLVADTSIQPGDYLSFVLKRLPASSEEDPNSIKVFAISLDIVMDETAVSDCPGRIGRIIDTVRDLFNESGGDFLSDQFILRSVNRCLQELAQDDYWRTESWIPSVAGTNRIDLLAAIPRFQDVHQVRFSGRTNPMVPLGGYKEYDDLRTASNSSGVPECYTVQNTSLFVWPPPQESLAEGFCIYHSYLPADLTCGEESADPPVPRAHDMVFVYYVLRQAFLRDRHAPGADLKFQEYSALYDREKQKLLSEGDPPGLSLRPYR